MDIFGCKRSDAVALLYALWKKERYERRGFAALVYPGIFASDDRYEILVWRKPKRHGEFIT